MSQPASQSTSTQGDNQNPFIRSSASLTITMTMSTPVTTTSRRTKKYRPTQRSDGVVIVHPRYAPSNPLSNPAVKFEAQPLQLPPPPTNTSSFDMSAIRAQLANISKGKPNGVLDCGRGGYNGSFDRRNERWDENEAKSFVMQRFLADQGPWNTYEVQAR